MTRHDETVAMVSRWVSGELPPEEVWRWALDAKRAAAEDPTSRSDNELVRDIIDILSGLPFDLITTEDAQVMLDGLANPPEETDLAVNLLWNHLDSVNSEQRRRELKDDPFYGPYCAATD